MTRTTAALLSAAVSAALVTASLFAFAMPAAAHDGLVESTPTAGETLTALPDEFSVTMNDDLLDLEGEGSGFGLLVHDADGLYYGDGCVTVDGPTMSADAVIGEPGEYTVIWQVVSSDGHPTSDQFTFTWAPAGDFEAAAGSTEAGDCNGLYARDDDAANDADSGDEGLSGLVIAGAVILSAAIVAVVLLLRRRRRDALVGRRS